MMVSLRGILAQDIDRDTRIVAIIQITIAASFVICSVVIGCICRQRRRNQSALSTGHGYDAQMDQQTNLPTATIVGAGKNSQTGHATGGMSGVSGGLARSRGGNMSHLGGMQRAGGFGSSSFGGISSSSGGISSRTGGISSSSGGISSSSGGGGFSSGGCGGI